MIRLKRIRSKLPVIGLSCSICLLAATMAFASEGGGGWRDIYDIVMKWVNFFILSFLLYKFLGGPLKNFFSKQKAELARQIEVLEKEKEEKIKSIDAARKEFEGSEDRLAALKEKIIHRGKMQKEALIQTAQEQSRLMLENAQRKVAFRIEQAKANFRVELIDTAIDTAIKHLPSHMTDQDNLRLLQLFLDDPQLARK